MEVFDEFTLLDWKSIPPILKEYSVGKSIYTLPSNVTIQTTSSGRLAFYCTAGTTAHAVLQKEVFNTARKGLTETYLHIAKLLGSSQAYLSHDHLLIKKHPAVTDTVRHTVLENAGLLNDERFEHARIGRTSKSSISVFYVPPSRLKKYVLSRKRTWTIKASTFDVDKQELIRAASQLSELHKTLLEMLLSDFERKREMVRLSKRRL